MSASNRSALLRLAAWEGAMLLLSIVLYAIFG